MLLNLKNRSLLTLLDYNKDEINYLLKLAQKLKENKKNGKIGNSLQGKHVALIFEKPSTRTRCAFAVGVSDEGGVAEYLGRNDIQLGKKESVADTARVLGRMFSGIQFRGYQQKTVELLAKYAGIPVWNGLTDEFHPTQVLADLLTIKENFGKLENINFVYVGDGRNNVANSLMIGCIIMGVNYTLIAPESLLPEKKLLNKCYQLSQQSGSEIKLITDPEKGVQGADVIYTDVWVSMGEEEKFAHRINLLKSYQVNQQMIENTGNDRVIFLHCLPAYHNIKTENGKMIYDKYGLKEMEVTDRIFESNYSRVFDQAENRLHTIKAVMVATLSD